MRSYLMVPVLALACTLAMPVHAATPIDQTRPLDANGRVEVDNLKGRVEVRGWDDTALARYAAPSVSSIAPDKSEIARLALGLLKDRMGGHDGVGRHVFAPYSIAERDSTLSM